MNRRGRVGVGGETVIVYPGSQEKETPQGKGEKRPETSFTILPTVKKMIKDTQNQARGRPQVQFFLQELALPELWRTSVMGLSMQGGSAAC